MQTTPPFRRPLQRAPFTALDLAVAVSTLKPERHEPSAAEVDGWLLGVLFAHSAASASHRYCPEWV
jgi:hypothetical protein